MIDNLVKTLAELEVLGVKVSEPHLPGIAKLHKKIVSAYNIFSANNCMHASVYYCQYTYAQFTHNCPYIRILSSNLQP